MTKIAIISDIHGNLHALEAVIKDLKLTAPEQVLVDGDMVGRGPQSEAVLELVAEQNWDVVMGNHEEFWAQCHRGDLPPSWEDNWWKPTREQIEALPDKWFEWMEHLPVEYIINVPGAPSIQVVHGSPRRINEGLYAHVPETALQETLGNTPHPIVIGAHTHAAMSRRTGDYWVLNCGSVGAPFNQDPAAQYLLMIEKQGVWHAEFRRVQYNHLDALRYWQASGYLASGVAAQIFAYELETATFHFWHYVRYCEVNGISFNRPASFALYREEWPAYEQYCAINNLSLHDINSLHKFRKVQAGTD
jgi:putative phosphoesterase